MSGLSSGSSALSEQFRAKYLITERERFFRFESPESAYRVKLVANEFFPPRSQSDASVQIKNRGEKEAAAFCFPWIRA